jgi:ABC-type spermidine/putrescine transport system permease subunit I
MRSLSILSCCLWSKAKHQQHRYLKSLNRLLKVCYVPATFAVLIAFFFAVAIKSTNEANKATKAIFLVVCDPSMNEL